MPAGSSHVASPRNGRPPWPWPSISKRSSAEAIRPFEFCVLGLSELALFGAQTLRRPQQHTSRTGETEQLLRDTLCGLSSGVGQKDGQVHRGHLPAQSRAGAGQPHGLQQVSGGASLGFAVGQEAGNKQRFRAAAGGLTTRPPKRQGSTAANDQAQLALLALASIGDEGHRELASLCAQISNRFGAQIDHARRTAKEWELAKIIMFLQREQAAETAAASREAQAKTRAQQERLIHEQGSAAASRPLAAGQTTAPPQLRRT